MLSDIFILIPLLAILFLMVLGMMFSRWGVVMLFWAAFLVLAMTLGGNAHAQEAPTEELKIEALKLGYVLNGNSMVRWGSIDLTSILQPMRPMPQFEMPYVRQSGGPR